MTDIVFLMVAVSFYLFLPVFFLMARKKVKKRLSLEELKREFKTTKMLFVSFLILGIILFFFKFYSIIDFIDSILWSFPMAYFAISYLFIIIKPCIKEKEKEEKK